MARQSYADRKSRDVWTSNSKWRIISKKVNYLILFWYKYCSLSQLSSICNIILASVGRNPSLVQSTTLKLSSYFNRSSTFSALQQHYHDVRDRCKLLIKKSNEGRKTLLLPWHGKYCVYVFFFLFVFFLPNLQSFAWHTNSVALLDIQAALYLHQTKSIVNLYLFDQFISSNILTLIEMYKIQLLKKTPSSIAANY